MNLDQGLHNGLQEGEGLAVGNFPAALFQICFEAHAVNIFHDEIGRAVFFKIVLHRDDIGGALQLGKNFCLLQKPFHAILVVLLHPSGQGHAVAVSVPCGQSGGHIFFDGDLDFQSQIIPQIGDAKAADAQNLSHQVSAVQDRPQGQGQIGLLLLVIKPAARTPLPRLFFRKTAITNTFRIHGTTSLISANTKSSSDTCRTRWACRRSSASSQCSLSAALRNSICTSNGSM